MTRGSESWERPPRWAWIVSGVVVVAIAVIVVGPWSKHPVSAAGSAPLPPMPTVGAAPSTASGPKHIPRDASGVAHVVFAGDSLTYGLFASTESAGYRPQLVQAWSASGPVDASRGGQTGNTVKTVTDSITFPATTTLAVLELGTNDLGKTPFDQLQSDYQALVTKVKTSAPHAMILCLGAWTNIDGDRNNDQAIERPCVQGGGIYVPLWRLFDDPTDRGPSGRQAFGGTGDNFHPNDKGYKAIADLVLSVVGP
jgi:lysophospholipase L1-like esterase